MILKFTILEMYYKISMHWAYDLDRIQKAKNVNILTNRKYTN